MATFASRRCRGIFRAARAVMGFAFLFGATALNEAWVPGRISAARRSRESVARGDGAREESQELMDQLADDMDELMKLLQEGKTEGDDSSEDSNEDSSESDVDMVDGDVDDLEASPETSEAALVTVDTEAAQAISCLDVSGLRRVPGSANEYIVTTQQLQSIVNSKVQQFTAVIKGFEKYIEELEQELESTETELEEKDATLQVENERRQALEAELLTLKGRAEEMEQQLADAQQATLDATSMLANLDQQAERIAERVTSGEISEEESHEIEEELIRAQAKRLAASKTEERSEQQLDEAMGTCCSKDESDKLEAIETKDSVPTAPETVVVEDSGPQPREGEFAIVLDKTNGERLGMDVDHEDGRTLAVDAITGGLIQKWNEEHPDKALRPKDRIVEVNGLRGDVLQLVDECKKPKVLTIYVKRESH